MGENTRRTFDGNLSLTPAEASVIMSDLSADLLAVVAELDTSPRSLDLVCGLSFKILGRQNALDRRLVDHEKTLGTLMRLNEIVGRLARRLGRLENAPAAIAEDEVKESALRPVDTRRSRKGRPRGSLNKKTLARLAEERRAGNGLGTAA
jgi:hypothetical protein